MLRRVHPEARATPASSPTGSVSLTTQRSPHSAAGACQSQTLCGGSLLFYPFIWSHCCQLLPPFCMTQACLVSGFFSHFCSISNASLLSPCQKLNSLKTGHRSCLQHIHKATQTTVFLTKASVVPTSTALSVAPSWPPSTPHNGPPFQAPSLRRVSSPAAISYLLQDCWDRCGTVTASGQLSPDSPQRGSDKVQSP